MAVFLKVTPDQGDDMARLADLRVDLIDETGLFFDLVAFPADAYEARAPLMWDIRGQGRGL